MEVAFASSCTEVHLFESLQEEWPELNFTYSRHRDKVKSSVADINGLTSSSAQLGIDYLSEKFFIYGSVNAVDKTSTNNIVDNVDVVSLSSTKSTEVNASTSDVDIHYTTSCNVHIDAIHLDVTACTDSPSIGVPNVTIDSNVTIESNPSIDANVTTSTASSPSSELNSKANCANCGRLTKKKKTKGKAKRKIRTKSTKYWKTLDISQFGFHISRFPSAFASCDEVDGSLNSLIQISSEEDSGNETFVSPTADSCETMKAEQLQSNEGNTLSQETSQLDDILFFSNIGIDVINDVELNPLSRDNLSSGDFSKMSGKLHNTINESYFSEKLKDWVFSSYDNIPFRKKCNKLNIYDLECVSSHKVQLRPDKHRRIEKAHKAVKSKNMKSLSNNKGRKTLYMHHRLVKKHNLDLDFRHSAKTQRFSAMTKKSVDTIVAKQLFKADGNTPQSTTAPPVQNLKHALHETNAPTQMETDLANFLITLQHRDLTPEDYDMLLRLDDSVKPKTVSNNFLDRLRTQLIGPDGLDCEDDTLPICSICMELYMAGQTLKFLPCSHYFHSNCIDSWLKNSSMNCPLDGLPVDPS